MDKHRLKKLGDFIRAARINVGYSQEELASKVGFHRTYIGMVERGEKNITILNFTKIVRVLKLNVKEIFEKLV